MLSVMSLYQNELEIMTAIPVYNNNNLYLKSVVGRSKSVVSCRIAISRYYGGATGACSKFRFAIGKNAAGTD